MGGKVIMDIESIQNQLFIERSEEFLKEIHLKKDDYKQCVFKDLEELLGEKMLNILWFRRSIAALLQSHMNIDALNERLYEIPRVYGGIDEVINKQS